MTYNDITNVLRLVYVGRRVASMAKKFQYVTFNTLVGDEYFVKLDSPGHSHGFWR